MSQNKSLATLTNISEFNYIQLVLLLTTTRNTKVFTLGECFFQVLLAQRKNLSEKIDS